VLLLFCDKSGEKRKNNFRFWSLLLLLQEQSAREKLLKKVSKIQEVILDFEEIPMLFTIFHLFWGWHAYIQTEVSTYIQMYAS